MRVVIPVLNLEYGGERIIAEIANGLIEKGHQVILAIPYGGRVAWPVRAEIHWVPELNAKSIPAGDIIMPNFYPTVRPAIASGKGRCVRLSLGFEPLWVDNREAVASYRYPMPVIVISEWLRSLIKTVAVGPVHLLHPGVDTSVFHPYAKPNDGKLRLLYLYRPNGYSWKGLPEFTEAHVILAREFPGLEVHLMRCGSILSHQNYPHPCHWRTASNDEEMGRLYAEADVFAYPSRFESFGLPPLEAMACGTAPVIGHCGGVREYAVHLDNCLLVETGNAWALASTIAALLRDRDARERIAARGIATAQAWTWQRTYQEAEQILLQVLSS